MDDTKLKFVITMRYKSIRILRTHSYNLKNIYIILSYIIIKIMIWNLQFKHHIN